MIAVSCWSDMSPCRSAQPKSLLQEKWPEGHRAYWPKLSFCLVVLGKPLQASLFYGLFFLSSRSVLEQSVDTLLCHGVIPRSGLLVN